METRARGGRLGGLFLAAGAALGVALAVRGVVRSEVAARALPRDAVALVGDAPISQDEYARALAAAVEDRPDHREDAALRREVLDRLIDERLLEQAALDMKLPERDPRLRGQVAEAMSDTVTGEAITPPTDEALRAYEAAHAASFTRGGKVRIQAISFRGTGAADRADTARARLLVGQALGSAAEVADPRAVDIPADAVPLDEVARLLGVQAARAVDALAPGEVTEAITVAENLWVIRLAAREGGELAPLQDVRSTVVAGWRREEGERLLRRWLEQRRRETRVVVREPQP